MCPDAIRLVIVGGGPSCTYAVERLAALLSDRAPSRSLRLTIFERTGEFGAGETHSANQPETSMMNRVASQVAFGADEGISSVLLPAKHRFSLAEWCSRRYAETRDERFAIAAQDYPTRAIHGLALADAFSRYLKLLRDVDGVAVELIDAEVVDVERLEAERPSSPRASVYRVHATGGGGPRLADVILFATGHSSNHPAAGSLEDRLARRAEANPDFDFVECVYPLRERVTPDLVKSGCRVGIIGLGLTAVDLILYLTEGRGGRFVEESDGILSYVRAGSEPAVIVGMSQSGLPTFARPRNEKAREPSGRGHSAHENAGTFLTVEAIEELRRGRGRPARVEGRGIVRQLDFDRHVLPLIVLEMTFLYYLTSFGKRHGDELSAAARPRYALFLSDQRQGCPDPIEFLLEPLHMAAARLERVSERVSTAAGGHPPTPEVPFRWKLVFDPIAGVTADADSWRSAVERFMERDLAEATEGNVTNAIKSAVDGTWRDLRGPLAAAVDSGGLTPASNRSFAAGHFRYYSRLSNGASAAAMGKVLALLRAGVVDLGLGPRPAIDDERSAGTVRLVGPLTGYATNVSAVIDARTHSFDPIRDTRPLFPALIKRKLVRCFRNQNAGGTIVYDPGALALSSAFHPLSADGSEDRDLTFHGRASEGALPFILSAARPHACSFPLRAANSWAVEFVERHLR